MKTLAEQSMKQQVDAAPPPVQMNTSIKLVDTTNIVNQHNGKSRKSLTRQSQVDSLSEDFVAMAKKSSKQMNGQANNIHKQPAGDSVHVFKEGDTLNKLNGHVTSAQAGVKSDRPCQEERARRNDARLASVAADESTRRRKPSAEVLAKTTPGVNEKTDEREAEKKVPESAAAVGRDIGIVKKLTIDCLLYLIKGLIATYDLISQPVCYFKHEVARRRREVNQVRSLKFNLNDPMSPWRQIDIEPHQLEIERRINSFQTYDQMMKASYIANGPSLCYGYRQVLDERMSKRADNPDKLIRQVSLSDYKWCTYAQFELQIETARRGLLRDGIRAGQRVILFADTRAEWQICSQALIRLGAVVATMYSTLGIDGIVHTVNETQAQLIITQHDKVDRLMRLSSKLPQLKKIVYFEPSLYLPRQLGGEPEDEEKFLQLAAASSVDLADGGVARVSLCQIMKSGLDVNKPEARDELKRLEEENNGDAKLSRRTKDMLAVIMYTSGSTGIPKGVLISHGNIQATIKSFSYVTRDFIKRPGENVCAAYLPLAHIFEFCIESVMLFHGVKFGFASPHTLTDKSPGLMAGQAGDLGKLQPTVMIIVPLILDRIVQGIKQALKEQSYFKEKLVSYLIDYKIYWQKRFYETPLVDKLICSKMAVALGGRAKYVICGSAPLSGETQTFVRAALNLNLPQGFGTTETCAATCCQLFEDQSTMNVGPPVSGAHIKLEPWLEGNYRPDDRPNPRGEIVVGGEMIAHGYFNLEEQTKEAFYIDEEGRRWYRTGDIGEFLPNGQLKIIDRKKDLVKLQNGEYISLGRVESTLKSNPYTDNFCVYANSNYNYVIALGPANESAIRTLAQQIVDESERKLSPSMVKRFGGSQTNMNNGEQPENEREDERDTLLISDGVRQSALAELKEVLATYETDRINNNNINENENENEKNEKEENREQPAESRSRANSTDPAPLSSCLNERLNRLCENKLIQERVHSFLCKMARDRSLLTLEIPKKILLLAEEWTEDKNLVTAALKIRRNYIYKRYERELEQLYAQ